MTAPFTFVNTTTAPLYGVSGSFGSSLTRVDLRPDASGRACSRSSASWRPTRTATRARRSTAARTSSAACCARRSPIRRPTCPQLPTLMATQTTREQVDMHTAPSRMLGLPPPVINPVGFGFENYDAAGVCRTTRERGHHQRHRHAGRDGGQHRASPTACPRSAAIAASPEAQRCYSADLDALRVRARRRPPPRPAPSQVLGARPAGRQLQGHRPDGRHHADHGLHVPGEQLMKTQAFKRRYVPAGARRRHPGPALPRDLRAAQGRRADDGDAEAAGGVLQPQRREHAGLVPDHRVRRADARRRSRAPGSSRSRSYAPKILVPRGLHQVPRGFGRDPSGGDDHARGVGCKLTAAPLADTTERYATGVSIDQVIAKAVNPGGKGALNLMVGYRNKDVLGCISYVGRRPAGEPVPGPVEGVQGLDRHGRLGRDRGRQAGDAAQERHRRCARAQFDALNGHPALSSQDKQKLDLYASSHPHHREDGDDGRPAASAACPTRAPPRSWRSTRRTSRATASTRRSAA